MKKTRIIGIMALVSFSNAYGQNVTLIKSIENVGFFVKPYVQATQLAGEPAGMVNINAAVTFNNKFSIGAVYGQTFNEVLPVSTPNENAYLDLRMGGATVEYTFASNRLIHFSIPVAVGAGEVEYGWRDEFGYDFNDDQPYGEDYFFYVEPGAILEINVLPFMKFSTGATYRFVPGGVDYQQLDAADVSGLTFSAGLKFGIF